MTFSPARTRRFAFALMVVAGVGLSACGDDSSSSSATEEDADAAGDQADVLAAAETTTVPTTTTVAVTEPPAVVEEETAAALGPDEEAAMMAWATVFDSAVEMSDKVPHLEDSASLEASNARYAEAADEVGGIGLEPTSAVVDGDSAAVIYNVLFGGVAAYSDLEGPIQKVDGVWVVSREEYCGFLASARTPCDEQ